MKRHVYSSLIWCWRRNIIHSYSWSFSLICSGGDSSSIIFGFSSIRCGINSGRRSNNWRCDI